MSTLAAIYGQERSARRVVGHLWFVATRQGLVGVRSWLVSAAPAPAMVAQAAAPEAEAPTPELPVVAEAPVRDEPDRYAGWLARFDPLQPGPLALARRHHASLALPDVLILAVVDRAALGFVPRALESWRRSIHGGWRAGIVPVADLTAAELDRLRAAIADEPRAAVLTGPAWREAASGPVLLCFGAVMLNELSLYMLLEAAGRTGAGIVYCDHDVMAQDGQRADPAFKPQFSPEYLARFNYIGDCLLLSSAALLTAADAGSLPGLTVAGYDRLVARLAIGRQVEHVPFTLFHLAGEPARTPHDLRVFTADGPSVAIIIPTRDGLQHLRPCVQSILEKTRYDLARVEIVVVDNNSTEAETLDYLEALQARPNVSVVRYPGRFNFAEINNAGARATSRDVLVFLNNDTVVHDPAWLDKLAGYAWQPGVGMVGGKLLFPDGTIQHGGCVAGSSMGTVQHLLTGALPANVATTDHTREMSVVTGACVAVRRDVFDRVGGFDPILAITWNDVKTCLECLAAGLRNLYVADPLFIHDESSTRGHDDTRERYVRYFSEATYTRARFRTFFWDDPSYNPNLSLEQAGDLADPPRVRRPWFGLAGSGPRILVLSTVYCVGFGVPVVIQQHVRTLMALGYQVVIGGPLRDNEIDFVGCERVIIGSVKEAAAYAYTHDVALVISHTPPFFEVPILIGGHIPVLAYDYGEPTADFFAEPLRSHLLEVGYQKRAAAALTTQIATISNAVKNETLNKDAVVVGLANSHLPSWSDTLVPERDAFRGAHGWNGRFVVLTVCRFYPNERSYKGLDRVAAILREFPYLYPAQSKPVVWVLAGAGMPEDVAVAEQLGFTVFPNVTDAVMAELYKAADAYMSFSKWEGYNLGISQALAMGLPTLGSDIPAHREFPITTTNSTLEACGWLAGVVDAREGRQRTATVYPWDVSARAMAALVGELIGQAAIPAPRSGASGRVWEDAGALPA